MHEATKGRGAPEHRVPIEFGSGTAVVTQLDRVRVDRVRVERGGERVSLARSRELIVRRLLACGISPTTLRVLLPERRALIDRLVA